MSEKENDQFREDNYGPEELQGKELKEVVKICSAHSPDESLELVFYLKCAGEVVSVAKRLAQDETTGGWIGHGEPTRLFHQSMADIDRVYVYGKSEGIVVMRTPLSNLSEADPLYQILMLAVGGPVLEFVYYSRVVFLDFRLPGRLLKRFPGPGFGLKGIRKWLNLTDSEPILGTIIKPCAGLTAEEVAEKCYQAARGGCQFIKDDEKMLGPDYCCDRKKIKLVSAALKKAWEET
ncbi:MAG: RuBisCO large subunit C-terminal-like domain-containing protein, partial [Candidatus Omnitrophica bacterium]|nr:RuBisCO large subunit C-terminal-like domain-containing protein [Candidatus Omnitrophota bacterium]